MPKITITRTKKSWVVAVTADDESDIPASIDLADRVACQLDAERPLRPPPLSKGDRDNRDVERVLAAVAAMMPGRAWRDIRAACGVSKDRAPAARDKLLADGRIEYVTEDYVDGTGRRQKRTILRVTQKPAGSYFVKSNGTDLAAVVVEGLRNVVIESGGMYVEGIS